MYFTNQVTDNPDLHAALGIPDATKVAIHSRAILANIEHDNTAVAMAWTAEICETPEEIMYAGFATHEYATKLPLIPKAQHHILKMLAEGGIDFGFDVRTLPGGRPTVALVLPKPEDMPADFDIEPFLQAITKLVKNDSAVTELLDQKDADIAAIYNELESIRETLASDNGLPAAHLADLVQRRNKLEQALTNIGRPLFRQLNVSTDREGWIKELDQLNAYLNNNDVPLSQDEEAHLRARRSELERRLNSTSEADTNINKATNLTEAAYTARINSITTLEGVDAYRKELYGYAKGLEDEMHDSGNKLTQSRAGLLKSAIEHVRRALVSLSSHEFLIRNPVALGKSAREIYGDR